MTDIEKWKDFLISMNIEFKNGSKIETLPNADDVVRGKRANTDHWLYDYEICHKEVFDEVLKSFCLKWYQKIWLKIIWKFKCGKRNRIYVSSKKWRKTDEKD